MTFDTENLEWRGYPMVKKVWGYDYLFWQTDTQKDGHRMTSKEKNRFSNNSAADCPDFSKILHREAE